MRILAFWVLATALLAQSSEVRVSAPNTIPEMRSRFYAGRYEIRNATVVDLIHTAWSIDADKILGGPDWLGAERFDLTVNAPANSSPDALRGLLRSILADRFHLAARADTRALPAYLMTVAGIPRMKSGSQGGSQDGKAGCETHRPNPATVTLECRDVTIEVFTKALSGAREASGYLFDYPIVDRTGLKGEWSFDLTWSPRMALRANPPASDPTTIFDALQKQLGLRLDLRKISTPVVIVEKATKPEQPPRNEPSARPQFEVADIKPLQDFDPASPCSNVAIQPGGRVTIRMTLKGLISEAWGAMDPAKIVDTPKILSETGSPCFVIVAKAPVEEGAKEGWNGPVWNGVDIDSMRMMLRSLLIDRFALVAHTEDRSISGYALVAGKPRLRTANPANRAGCREGPGDDGRDPRLTALIASRLITCRNMTTAQFAAEMNRLFVELPPVVDATGLSGRYDMTVSWSSGPAVMAADAEPNGAISFSEALSRQLGLKLRPRKVMAPVLVVDSVNKMPSAN